MNCFLQQGADQQAAMTAQNRAAVVNGAGAADEIESGPATPIEEQPPHAALLAGVDPAVRRNISFIHRRMFDSYTFCARRLTHN